ncbi:hypothetical protein ACWKWC_03340 [Geodermatophilus nigrescens]
MAASVGMTVSLAAQVYPASDRLAAAIAAALIAVGPLLLGSTAVRLHGARLEVINPLLISSVALDDVAYLDHHRGFQIVLKSGHRVDFAGSAPSLIGAMTRYWSARRMIERLQASVDRPLTEQTLWQPGDYRVHRRPRISAFAWCAAYMIIGTASAMWLGAAL